MVSLPVMCPLGFFFFFLPYQAVCGILIPQPGIEPVPPALGAQSLNHWTTRKSPFSLFKVAFLHSLFIDIIF